MKITPDDPRLSAWLLGELPAEEAERVERAVAENPNLAEHARIMRNLHAFLDSALAQPAAGLLPSQVAAIRAAVRNEQAPPNRIPFPPKKRPSWFWAVPTAAAILICGGLLVIDKLPAIRLADGHGAENRPAPPQQADGRMDYLPLPGPSENPLEDSASVKVNRPAETPRHLRDMQAAALRDDPEAFLRGMEKSLQTGPLPDMASLPPLDRRGFVQTGFKPGFELPVLAGRASFRWVSGYVHERGELPPAPTVRLEELVNAASPGISGVSKTAGEVTVSVETLVCQWKPTSLIAAIGIRGAPHGTRNVEARMHINKGTVSKYRLLGYDPVRGAGASAIPCKVPEGESTVVLVEMQPYGKAENLGKIGVAVGDAEKTTTSIELPQAGEYSPSPGASLAMLMAGFSEWLSGAEGAPDIVVLDAMLHEARAKNANASGPQADALALVADTLALVRRSH